MNKNLMIGAIGILLTVLVLLFVYLATTITFDTDTVGVRDGGSWYRSQACKNQEGSLQAVNISNQNICVIPVDDTGRSCSDSAECEGQCFATERTPIGSEVVGFCGSLSLVFGCHLYVVDGKAQYMCTD